MLKISSVDWDSLKFSFCREYSKSLARCPWASYVPQKESNSFKSIEPSLYNLFIELIVFTLRFEPSFDSSFDGINLCVILSSAIKVYLVREPNLSLTNSTEYPFSGAIDNSTITLLAWLIIWLRSNSLIL
jgi:hypothetical protein